MSKQRKAAKKDERKTGMKKLLGRILVVIPAVTLQVLWYLIVFGALDTLTKGILSDVLSIVFTILAVLFVVSLVSRRDESSYKLLWVIVILVTPILGAILYLMLGNKNTGKKLKKKMHASAEAFSVGDYAAGKDLSGELMKVDLRMAQSIAHVAKTTGFPVVKNGTSRYYPFGEEMFPDM